MVRVQDAITLDQMLQLADMLLDENVLRWSADDFYRPMERGAVARTLMDTGIKVMCFKEEQLAGFFWLTPWNAAAWEVHTTIKKTARGPYSENIARKMLHHIKGRVRVLITQVPRYNYPARTLAKRMGMTQCGTVPAAFLKNGKYHDIDLYHLNVRDWCSADRRE